MSKTKKTPMGKYVSNYVGFVNEGMNFSKIRQWFTEKFTKGAWLKFALWLQKKGILKKYGVEILDFSGPAATYAPTTESIINEAIVKLEYPVPNTVPDIGPEELYDELSYHFHSKRPICVWGAPGIGKSDIVKQLGRKEQIPIIIINLKMRDPVDFIGVPSVEKVKKKIYGEDGKMIDSGEMIGRTIYNIPAIFPEDDGQNGRGGILFFDELNRANQHVMDSSMNLILDREIEDYKLPAKWVIFAACNRKEEAPEVTDLGHAFANRLKHVNYVPTVGGWSRWAREKAFVDPMLVGFLEYNDKHGEKKLFHRLDTGKADTPVWASPRSWVAGSTEYFERFGFQGIRSPEKIMRIYSGHVGMEAATEFANFVRLASEFSPDDIEKVYTDYKNAPIPKKKSGLYVPSVAYAIISAVASYHQRDKISIGEYENLVRWSCELGEMEYATALMKLVLKDHEELKKDPKTLEVNKIWANRYKEDLVVATGKK